MLAILLLLWSPLALAQSPEEAAIAQVRELLMTDFGISPRMLTQGQYLRESAVIGGQDQQVGMVVFVSEVTDHVYTAYLSLEDGQPLRVEEFYNAGDVCVTRSLLDLSAPSPYVARRAEADAGGQAIDRYAQAPLADEGQEDLPRQEAERIARAYAARELGQQAELAAQASLTLRGDDQGRWWLASLSRQDRPEGPPYLVALDAGSGLVLAATWTQGYLQGTEGRTD